MKQPAPVAAALAAFFAARAQRPADPAPEPVQPSAAVRRAIRSPVSEPPQTNDPREFTAFMRRRLEVLTTSDAEKASAEAELRSFLDATRARDRVANDNGAWLKARRASGQPGLRSLRYRAA